MKQQDFSVTGMSCAACSARVERVVGALAGVSEVQVNLLTRSMRIRYDEALLDENRIISAVEQAGYGASTTVVSTTENTGIRQRLLYSFICLIPMVCLHHLWHSGISTAVQLVLLIPILILNRKFFISGTQSALHGAPNMDTLISLGAAAGILYSLADLLILHSGVAYVESAGMILTLITLGKWLESRATSHTGDALSKLKSLLPQTATVLRHGRQEVIRAEQVIAGDSLFIPAGARVPVDATVTEGSTSIDESSLTGESMPVLKQAGDKIYAGTINGHGSLQACAICTRNESALNGIINLVGEAAASKAPIARLADRISSIFVPYVVAIAVLTALIWLLLGSTIPFALGCAIAVLVISCPCALGLATPVAIMAGAGKGAENGILFRNGATMETARNATAIILDKTGTITAGHPIVISVSPAEQVSKTKLLQLAYTLEQNNSHPLAQSIRKATAVYTPQSVDQLQYIPGRGVCAVIEGQIALAGNAALMLEHGITIPEREEAGISPLHFAVGGNYMGTICVADPIKPDSAAAIEAMKRRGLRVLIMSGDSEGTVRHIAAQAGIDEYHAGVTPQDKEAMVRKLQSEGHSVAMIGDGINDAPALMRADVGIAIGAGADIAIESAGIILVRNELMDAVGALNLSHAVIRTIRQNLFWAFFYNLLAIPLAAGLYYPFTGWLLSPAVAAAAMSISSLFVVCNALRLRHITLISTPQTSMNTTVISVQGMMCPHCERHVNQALSALPGITEVKADHKSATVSITSNGPVDESILAATIKEAGYDYKGVC